MNHPSTQLQLCWFAKVISIPGYTPTVPAFEALLTDHIIVLLLVGQMKSLRNEVAQVLIV